MSKAGQCPAPNCPHGGGSCLNQVNTATSSMNTAFGASTTASLSNNFNANASSSIGGCVGLLVCGGASASGSISNSTTAKAAADLHGSASENTGSANTASGTTCPPTLESSTSQTNISATTMSVDNSTLIMNNASINSMSSSINQMIVNSVTKTTTSASQTVNISQVMRIKVANVKGNVNIEGAKQEATIDMSNQVNMDYQAIDTVRNDLADNVLAQFSSGSNVEALATAQTGIDAAFENTQKNSTAQQNSVKVGQTQSTTIPMATPTQVQSPNPSANVCTTSNTLNDISSNTTISQPFTQSTNLSTTIQSSILNAVTQNFTHETVTQLVQSLTASQLMEIDVENIGGNVSILNPSQKFNVVFRQTLANKMNVGAAIMNSIVSSSGIKTDNNQSVKKSSSSTSKSASSARNSASTIIDSKSLFDYTQSIKQTLPIGESLGSSLSSCISCCICCILCCLVPMLAIKLRKPQPENDSEQELNPDGTNAAASDSSTSTDTPISDSSSTPEQKDQASSPVASPEADLDPSSESSSKASQVTEGGNYYY